MSIAKQHAAIRIFFQNDNPSRAEALRELGFDEEFRQVFDLIKNGAALIVFAGCRSTSPRTCNALQWNFLFAVLGGDLEVVKRILDYQQNHLNNVLTVHVIESTQPCSYVALCSPPLCTAAAQGHWKVVKAILAKLAEAVNVEIVSGFKSRDHQRAGLPLSEIDYLYRSVVVIAAQGNDFFIFSEKFAELENAISDISFLSDLFRESQPEFMDKVMNLLQFRLQHNRAMDFHSTFLQKLKYIFCREIRSHACPRHLDYVLQEIFPQKFVCQGSCTFPFRSAFGHQKSVSH